MSQLIDEANKLVTEAKGKGKCLDQAKNVERKLEDIKDAARVGNTGIFIGCGAIVIGGIAAFFTFGLGGTVAVGGGVAVANGLDAKASALSKATKELQRAVEDLKACLGAQ